MKIKKTEKRTKLKMRQFFVVVVVFLFFIEEWLFTACTEYKVNNRC